MAGLTIGARVYSRDNLGRFLSRLEEKGLRATRTTAVQAAEVARAYAPSKTGALRASIRAVPVTATMWGVVVGTNHWRYQETGTTPHPITGYVTFWWEREGRIWRPGPNIIQHPGHRGRHFMHMSTSYIRNNYTRNLERL